MDTDVGRSPASQGRAATPSEPSPAVSGKAGIPNAWQPIESAPLDRTVIVGDLDVGTTAVAHWEEGYRGGEWLLGPRSARYLCPLDFAPAWWLPRDYPNNPFKTPLMPRGEVA